MTTHARVTLLSGLIISALLLTGCDNSGNPQPHAQAPQVTVHVVNSAPLSVTTELPGRTSAFRVAEVRPQVSGIILKRNFVEGSDVEAGQSLYQIDPATYQAAWNSAKGDEAKAEAAAAIAHLTVKRYVPLLGTKYISQQEGSLQFSDVTVDESTGSITLRAIFPNPQHALLPGMFVRARIDEGVDPQAILVPQQGVTRTPRGDASVMLVNDKNQVETREVVATQAVGDKWLITSGLKPGDKVIVSGLQKVRPGVTVKAEAERAAPAAQ